MGMLKPKTNGGVRVTAVAVSNTSNDGRVLELKTNGVASVDIHVCL